MSSLSREHAVASQRVTFESLSDVWAKTFGCVEKLTELNLRAFQSTLAENQAVARAALSSKDAHVLFTLQARRAQRDAQAFVDTVATNAPAGSEAAVSALQSAVTTAGEATSATIEASKKATHRHWKLPKTM